MYDTFFAFSFHEDSAINSCFPLLKMSCMRITVNLSDLWFAPHRVATHSGTHERLNSGYKYYLKYVK